MRLFDRLLFVGFLVLRHGYFDGMFLRSLAPGMLLHRRRFWFRLYNLGLLVLAVDRITKLAERENLKQGFVGSSRRTLAGPV